LGGIIRLKEESIWKTHTKICRDNAKKHGHTEKEADKCDEIHKPICDFCPFITK
jgi:hypothetical protein